MSRGALVMVAALGTALAAELAPAANIIETHSLSISSEVVPLLAHVVGSLPKFDPAKGTLLKVTFYLESDTSPGTIHWENHAGVVSDITLGLGATVTATALTASATTAVPIAYSLGTTSAYDATADFLGGDTFSYARSSATDSASQVFTGADMSPYIGPGDFNVSLSSLVDTYELSDGGWGLIHTDPGTTQGTAKVTYEYQMPEPGGLVGGLLLGSLWLGRRRRHR